MKVILLTDVKNQGKKDQVIDVSDGYARNYLLRNGLAIEATKKSLEILNQQKNVVEKVKEGKSDDALKIKEEIEKTTLYFKVKSQDGKMFGNISSKQIADELLTKSVKIDKRKIISGVPIGELGSSMVKIEVYPKVLADLQVIVESE